MKGIQQFQTNLHFLMFPTTKFKTTTFLVSFAAPLTDEHIANRALLPYVMEKSTKHYPTLAALQTPLEALYDASLYAGASKIGQEHVIQFQLEVVNDSLVGEPLLEEAVKFLEEMLLHPNVTDGAFDPLVVEQEKRLQRQRIEAIYDDKMRYAQQRLQTMLGGELAIPSLGTLEGLDAVDASTLYDTYARMIREDRIDVHVVGDVNEDQVRAAFETLETLGFDRPRSYADFRARAYERLEETQDVKQSKLHLAYEVEVDPRSAEAVHMQVVNGLFGGFPHSKLFMNVREKESLAYYAASQYSSLNRMVFVYAGIDQVNQEKTETIIAAQLEALCAGEFEDAELEQTKEMLLHQRRQIADSPRQLLSWMSGADIRPFSIEEEMELIRAVTREDVQTLAKRLRLVATYCLKGVKA